MKKTLLLAFMLLLAVLGQAQDMALIERIRIAGSAITSIDSDLVNKTVKKKETVSQRGKLYYKANDQFAAIFTTGDEIIVNKNRMKINIGILHGQFKLGENGMMRSLSKVFLYSFQGRCQELANENNYSISTHDDANAHYVVFDSKKKIKIGLGYKQVVFLFDKSSLLIKEIQLVDYQNIVDTYTISNIKYNVTVSPDKFGM